MKAISILCLVLFAYTGIAQVHILNNNLDRPPEHYGSWSEAYAAASAGDTIYVMGSPYAYQTSGTTTINKQLTVIGPGFNLENTHDSLSFNDFSAQFNAIRLDTLADGSEIIGLIMSVLNIKADNILIKGCLVTGSLYFQIHTSPSRDDYEVSDVLIVDNFIDQISIDRRVFNCVISNNILRYISNSVNSEMQPLVIDHNTFVRGYSYGISNIYNSSISSNIFTHFLPTDYSSNQLGNSFLNNIAVNDHLPTGNGNLINQSCQSLIQYCIGSQPSNNDNNARLSNGSVAIGAGYGGTDAGCTDGNYPYVFAGFPPIPRLTDLIVQSISNQNSIDVQVQAVSQQ